MARRAGLGKARKAAGYSQESLAEALGIDRSTVRRWEAGDNEPSAFVRPAMADHLGLSRDELDLLLASEPGDRPPTPARTGPPSGDLAPLPGTDKGEAIVASAHESADFLAWAEVGNVGEMTIEQVQADVRELSRAYLKVDTEPLFLRTVALRDRLFELLRGRQKPAQTRELFSAAGWTLTLLAWISTDLGQPGAAETHLRAARVCADNAEHDLLSAWVAATRHTAAFWRDDHVTAGQHALSGLQFAPAGSGAALFLTSALALDLARYGDHPQAREVLTKARRHADQLEQADADGVAGPFACTPNRAGGFWADTHMALAEPQAALDLANRAIAGFDAAVPAQRNLGSERMVRCEQVKAHLALREYDGAAEAFQPVLGTEQEHRVGPLRRRVTEIAHLAGAADSATTNVRAIVDGATDFLQLPAPESPRSLS